MKIKTNINGDEVIDNFIKNDKRIPTRGYILLSLLILGIIFSVYRISRQDRVLSFLISKREVIAGEYRTAKQEFEQAKQRYDDLSIQSKAVNDLLTNYQEGKDITLETAKKVLEENYKVSFVPSGNRTNFIKNNAGQGYEDSARDFVDVGMAYKIDPDMLVCIAWADTRLGQNLKTRWNVGNVGNTDSGKTATYPSRYAGIEAIAKYALNGKYLKNKTMIKELTPAEGMPPPHYASSPVNWQRNVLSCLSDIKEKEIKSDYQFRL